MSLQDTLRKSLTPELYDQVMDALGDDFNFDLVTRARLNKVIKQRNELRDQLAGISQPQGGKSSSKKIDEDEDDDGTSGSEDVATQIANFKKQLTEQSEAAIKEVKIQYAALEKLRAADMLDPELVWSSSAIDKQKLSLDKDGKLVGLDEIITQLKKDKAHLFKAEGSGSEPPRGTGKSGGGGDGGSSGKVTTREEFLKLSAEDQIAFKAANPAVFKTFMSAT